MYTGALDSLPAFVALAGLGVVIAAVATRRRREVRTGWCLVAVYSALVLSVVLFPLPVTQEAIEYGRWRAERGLGSPNNFRLFEILRDTWSGGGFGRQVLANFALLFPLGVILGLLIPRRSNRWRIGLIGAVVLCIEGAQALLSEFYGFNFRSFDVDDLWLNMLGGLTGLLMARVLLAAWPRCADWCRQRNLLLVSQPASIEIARASKGSDQPREDAHQPG